MKVFPSVNYVTHSTDSLSYFVNRARLKRSSGADETRDGRHKEGRGTALTLSS
jgi:hypothetical protein